MNKESSSFLLTGKIPSLGSNLKLRIWISSEPFGVKYLQIKLIISLNSLSLLLAKLLPRERIKSYLFLSKLISFIPETEKFI